MATQGHTSCRKQTAFAWAKYYGAVNVRHEEGVGIYRTIAETLKRDIGYVLPPHLHTEIETMAKELKKTWECPVCIEIIAPGNLDITKCGHFFCKTCIRSYKEKEGDACKCPVCRRPL